MYRPQEIAANSDSVADELRSIFGLQKSQQIGKPYRPHERYRAPALWLKAAENCIQAGADPYSFVRAAFLYSDTPGGPFPQQLCGKAARYWYEEHCRLLDLKMGENAFEKEVKSAFSAVIKQSRVYHKTPRQILLDETSEHPAFVRVLLMPDDFDIWKRFRPDARDQLRKNKRLVDVLQKMNFALELLEKVMYAP